MDHFLAAPFYIQLHASSALLALALGPVAIYRKRRDLLHKTVGYVWIISMLAVGTSSFWIHSFGVIGPFSPIHLLAVWTIYVVIRSIQLARLGKIRAHSDMLRHLYWGGLWVAFAFNFLPNRMSNRIVFGQEEASVGAIFLILFVAATFLFGPRFKKFQRRLSAA